MPLGILLLASPFLMLPRIGFMSRGVLTTATIRIGYMFVAIGLTGLADTILKRIIGRVRPSELGPFAFEPVSWRSEYASLPSGHTTSVFATLVAVGLIFPRVRPLLWLYALFIAASRVIVSVHYPSDVLAGAAFGAFGAIVVRDWFAARRLGFYVGSDGRVQTMPGPSFRRIKRVARRWSANREFCRRPTSKSEVRAPGIISMTDASTPRNAGAGRFRRSSRCATRPAMSRR